MANTIIWWEPWQVYAKLTRRGCGAGRAGHLLTLPPSQEFLKQRLPFRLCQRGGTFCGAPLARTLLICASHVVGLARACATAPRLLRHSPGTDLRSIALRSVGLRRRIFGHCCQAVEQRGNL